MVKNGMTRVERMARKQRKMAAKTKLPKMYEVVENTSKAGVVYHNLRKKKDRQPEPLSLDWKILGKLKSKLARMAHIGERKK